MYINFNKLFSKEINPQELLFLQAVHQQKSEDLVDTIAMLAMDETIEKMLKKEWIYYIQGKKTELELSKLRTTKKGRTLLLDLQKSEDWDKETEIIYDWIVSVYKKRPNYVQSNHSEAKRRMQWFKMETGIAHNELSILLASFMKDTYVDNINDKRSFNEKFNDFKQENSRAQLSNKIENVLWMPKDRFQRHFNLEQSPLWNYYQENEKYIEIEWSKIK